MSKKHLLSRQLIPCPHVPFCRLYPCGFSFQFLHHNQIFYVIAKQSDYDIKKLIMMQQPEPRTVGLKLTKIVHVDRVKLSFNQKAQQVKYYTQELQKVSGHRSKITLSICTIYVLLESWWAFCITIGFLMP